MERMPVFCGKDCGGDACPLIAERDEGKVRRIVPNEAAGSFIRGCQKGFSLPAMHYSPARLKVPLARTGPRGSGQFRECSWPEAIKLVADGLSSCIESGGPGTVMDLSSAGSTGALHDTAKLTRRFLNLLGGCCAPAGNYSSNAANHALGTVFGPQYQESGIDASSMANSAMIVLLGANLAEVRLGADLLGHLLEAARKGVRIVSIDPRLTRTTKDTGAEWLPILPGTDAALLYSLLYLLDRRGIIDLPYMHARSEGFEVILDHVRGKVDGVPKTAAWASSVCGAEESAITGLAEAWVTVKPLMLIPGYSVQRSRFGEETMRLCVALQLASGNFGLQGGSTGSINNRLLKPKVGRIAVGESREGGRFPVLRWPDRILDGLAGESGRIRAVYTAGGNYLNQGADIGKGARALESLQFMVCHDLFLTPTARFADVVLPAASPLQKEDIGIPWSGNFLLYKPRILPCEWQERSDYEIFRSLADAFGFEAEYSEGRDEGDWIDKFLAESEIKDIEGFKSSGIYFGEGRVQSHLSRFASYPAGNPVGTASGKLELGSGSRASFDPGLHSPPAGEFLLITPKKADRVHSQGGHRPETIRRSDLWINRNEARDLGIGEGERVIVSSPQGSLEAFALPSDNITKGVVSLFEGVWHVVDPAEKNDGQEISSSPNLLTSTEGTEESVSCVMHGIAVRVQKAAAT